MSQYKEDLFEAAYVKSQHTHQKENISNVISLSPSSLNLFLECPRCFWLYLNKKIKRPVPPVATIATGLDRVIKNYFDQYRSKNILPPFLNGKIPGKLITNLPKKGWLDFTDAQYEARIGGYLDECIHLDDKYYAAFDHKTRGSAPDSVHKAYQLQMDVYTFLLEENKFPTKNTAYIAYYIPKKLIPQLEFEFEVLVKEIATDPKRAQRVFHEAINILRNPIPLINKDCGFCKWTATLEIR